MMLTLRSNDVVPYGTNEKIQADTLVTIKKFMDISVVGEERRIVADDSASIRLFFLLFQTA